jgi:hypothetical protein
MHHVVERYRLSVRFDDARSDHHAVLDLLLAENLEPFAGIAIEPAGVHGGDVSATAQFPLLALKPAFSANARQVKPPALVLP